MADWDYIPARGRKVIIAFDSDVTSNSDVRRARAILTEHFRRKGAKVKWVTLPHKPNGDKMGVDDYLLTHSPTDLLNLVQDAPADVAEEAHDERDKEISELKKALEREKRIVRGLRALLANPTLKAERATLATIGFEYYAKTSASGTPVRIYRAAIAEGAGNTPQTVSTHVKRGAELGVIEKFPTYDKDTMTSAMHIVCREPDLPEYLETLAGARPETKDGGVTGTPAKLPLGWRSALPKLSGAPSEDLGQDRGHPLRYGVRNRDLQQDPQDGPGASSTPNGWRSDAGVST